MNQLLERLHDDDDAEQLSRAELLELVTKLAGSHAALSERVERLEAVLVATRAAAAVIESPTPE